MAAVLYGPHCPLPALVVQLEPAEGVMSTGTEEPAGAEVAEVEVGVEFGVEVTAGEDAVLCVDEHPTRATTTALVIAAATVMRGRDRLIMDAP